MSDAQLTAIVSTPVSTIEEVIAVMTAIDDLLQTDDGLKWFNFLYLKVTEKVLANPPAGGWSSPVWLGRLDVVFAGLYFDAVRRWINSPASAPKAWRVLLDARRRQDVMRVQFALCGMNAHINRDLQLAVVMTGQELNIEPRIGSPEHDDFEKVNGILKEVEDEVLPVLATGLFGEIEQSLGRLDNVLALWSVTAARETAWFNAMLLWAVRDIAFLRNAKMAESDNITGALGRALIIPVGLPG
jgi:hypothetical protein